MPSTTTTFSILNHEVRNYPLPGHQVHPYHLTPPPPLTLSAPSPPPSSNAKFLPRPVSRPDQRVSAQPLRRPPVALPLPSQPASHRALQAPCLQAFLHSLLAASLAAVHLHSPRQAACLRFLRAAFLDFLLVGLRRDLRAPLLLFVSSFSFLKDVQGDRSG